MGGNIFKDKTQPIKKEHIEATVKMYFKELAKVFPGKASYFNEEYFKFVGSVGKKDYSGDIDFAVNHMIITDNTISNPAEKGWDLPSGEALEYFKKYKSRARTATDNELSTRAILTCIVNKINKEAENIYCDEKKITAGNIFGYFPQYDENYNKLEYSVQIDWMVGNMDWLEFSYYSEVYEGNVKGLHRTQLMLSLFNQLGYSFNHTKGVSEFSKTVASTPRDAIDLLKTKYEIEFEDDLMKSYQGIMKILVQIAAQQAKTDPSSDVVSRIFDIYLNILDKTRCDIPENLQAYWVNHKERLNLTGKFLPKDSKLYEEEKAA